MAANKYRANHRSNYRQIRTKQHRQNRFRASVLNVGAVFLLGLINTAIMIKNILAAILPVIIGRPFLVLGRWIFTRIVVPAYVFYLKIAKKLGFKGFRQSLISLIFNQKMVHVLVISLTVILIGVNLAPKTKAQSLTDRAGRTILAQIIQGEFSGFAEDEQFLVETFDREAVISDIQQSYLDNLGSFRPQPRASMSYSPEEELLPITQNGSSLVKPDIAATRITKQERTETITYEVQPGDTISTIAENFEISVSTILWENNLSAYSIIRPGQKLAILPVSGISHSVKRGETVSEIAKKYSLEEDRVLSANKMTATDSLQVGQKLILPGARKITYVAPTPKTYTGLNAIADIVSPAPAQPVGNKMAWPTVGARITQYYSWRHHGLDIANKTGTPIYASDSGTVELAGWGTGYGNQILIDHGGGKKTRYAHLSKFNVKKGDQVSKGQVIGLMGSTGWSTGPHLHFEVIINGTKYNPLNYIK